jgi:hypothetical protein
MSVQSQGKVFAAAPAPQLTERDMQRRDVLAWGLCLVFYFLQYALRSAPGLMTHELSAAFGLSALGLSCLCIWPASSTSPNSSSLMRPPRTGSSISLETDHEY